MQSGLLNLLRDRIVSPNIVVVLVDVVEVLVVEVPVVVDVLLVVFPTASVLLAPQRTNTTDMSPLHNKAGIAAAKTPSSTTSSVVVVTVDAFRDPLRNTNNAKSQLLEPYTVNYKSEPSTQGSSTQKPKQATDQSRRVSSSARTS